LSIKTRGGTNLAAGFTCASNMIEQELKKRTTLTKGHTENRIVFLTDLNPTSGETSSHGLFGLAKASAFKNIYATFIGVGLDFNTDLVEHITTDIRGANYLSVKSSKEFKKQLEEDFDYIVTALVFNVRVNLSGSGFHIDRVFGSPESTSSTGDLMKIGTLFPSAKEKSDETKGGVVLIKLTPSTEVRTRELKLKMAFEDREGHSNTTELELDLHEQTPNYFQNNGVRKAVLLTQYINLLKNFLAGNEVDSSSGILPAPLTSTHNKGKLEVSEKWKSLFMQFKDYFEAEMDAIGDASMEKEVKVLEEICQDKNATPKEKEPEVDKEADLIAMGFTAQQAQDALNKTGQDLARAADLLLNL